MNKFLLNSLQRFNMKNSRLIAFMVLLPIICMGLLGCGEKDRGRGSTHFYQPTANGGGAQTR